MEGLIIPKNYVETKQTPVIYLAGPIRSAPNWQDLTARTILEKNLELIVASPRREQDENGQKQYILSEKYLLKGNLTKFKRQREWEREYMELAAEKGTLLFWLPKEENHSCEKAYGKITAFELGIWLQNYLQNPNLNIVLGTDGEFSEIRTILYDYETDAPQLPIYADLNTTIKNAIKKAIK